MSVRELVWNASGNDPVAVEKAVVEDLVTFDLARRNKKGQALFADTVDADNFQQELAFLRDGTPRTY